MRRETPWTYRMQTSLVRDTPIVLSLFATTVLVLGEYNIEVASGGPEASSPFLLFSLFLPPVPRASLSLNAHTPIRISHRIALHRHIDKISAKFFKKRLKRKEKTRDAEWTE